MRNAKIFNYFQYSTHLNGHRFLDIIYVAIESAVCSSEDVAACYDGAATVGGHLSWRHQAHLKWKHLYIFITIYLYPTCQGYSLISVSCPPTILERLLAWPQVQVLVLPLGMVVAGGGVVVDTGEGVVVEAANGIVRSLTLE